MVRWNPCGAAVDVGRYGYDLVCNPFRNSDQEVTLRLYPVGDDAPNLPYPVQLVYHQWDGPYLRSDGSYYGPAVPNPPNNGIRGIPTALGLHQCGTPQDFAEGGLYLPDLPPVQYRADGLPVCCTPAVEGVGGGVGGGTATVTYVGPYSGSGGGVGGGSAPYRWGTVYPGSGGGVGSGTATVLTPHDRIGVGGGVAGGTATVTYVGPYSGSGGGVGGGTAEVVSGVTVVGSGGGVGGGTAEAVSGETVVGSGGGVGGGTAEAVSGETVVGSGGGVGGGTATVTSTGTSCATAVVLTSGVPVSTPIGAGATQWWTLGIVPGGGLWSVTIAGAAVTTVTLQQHGVSCALLAVDDVITGSGMSTRSTAGSPFLGFATVTATVADTYTVTITQM